jgi:hypothetical protein
MKRAKTDDEKKAETSEFFVKLGPNPSFPQSSSSEEPQVKPWPK